jgi:hypothetical protein
MGPQKYLQQSHNKNHCILIKRAISAKAPDYPVPPNHPGTHTSLTKRCCSKASDARKWRMVTLDLKKYSEINLKRFLFPENRISKRPLLKNCRKKSAAWTFLN